MCGILVARGAYNNTKIQKRGQDFTNTIKFGDLTFVHNLLAITGTFTKQPFIDGNIVCLYNGEIYNHPFKESDGEVLIPLYKQYGKDFAKHLDGEFSIALYDFDKNIVIFATDPFGSKPLWINGVECGSYPSGVGGQKMKPNTIFVKNFNGEIISEERTYEWDLRQFKNTYQDWIVAFEKAVKKRAKDGCFLGLSSGYDSGAIACAMLKQGIDFKAYSYKGSESMDVLEARQKLVKNFEYFEPDKSLMSYLKENIDNEKYTIFYKGKETEMRCLDDGGILGVATISNLANKEGRKVAMSGQGGDEIYSDYKTWPDQAELAGVYPKELKLWRNFHYGCQESYLMKEEFAGGAFNIETRYPFLDKDVVQEFLWLSQDLKNKNYKAPIREYLIQNHFPFKENIKRGFSIQL